MEIIEENTVAFTGHRAVKKDFNIEDLIYTVESLIIGGKDTFLIGMAIGFDTICFETLLKLKKSYPQIKIVACIPCENQSKSWNFAQKIKYNYLLEKADEKIILGKEYSPNAMLKRNRFMVDNSSVLVAYIYKTVGGSYYTAKYAVENDKEIIYVK